MNLTPYDGHMAPGRSPAGAHDARAGALEPGRLITWLQAYETCVADATPRVVERMCRRCGVSPPPHGRRMGYAAASAWLGEAWPISAYAAAANRLALLDSGALRRVLAARAIHPSRGMLRRIVSGEQRRALVLALGDAAFSALVQAGLNTAGAGTPLPRDLGAGALARAGYALVLQDGGWTFPRARRLIDLALDSPTAGETADAAHPAVAGIVLHAGVAAAASSGYNAQRAEAIDDKALASYACGGTRDFMRGAGTFFPELTWLFG